MDPLYLWQFLIPGYLLTIAIETPLLMFGLATRHSYGRRLLCGFWLTAVTYPIVVLVLPMIFPSPHWLFLLVAEIFAPVAECLVFRWAFHQDSAFPKRSKYRDYAAIILANLLSFGIGLLLLEWGVFYWLNG